MPEGVSGTLLGFDFGLRRIGIAIGNTLTAQARPLTTIDDERNSVRFARIAEILTEWQPAALIVGLPAHDDDQPHEFAPRCRRFANQLKGRFGLPVGLVNERYSSALASSELSARGIHGQAQKTTLDAEAAAVILQAYLIEPAASQFV